MSRYTIIFAAILATGSITPGLRAQWSRIESPEIEIPLSPTCIAARGDTIIVGAYRGLIYRSLDGGTTWTALMDGLESIYWTECLLMEGTTIIAGATDGIYRSTNLGDTWALTNTASTGGPIGGVTAILRVGPDLLCATGLGIYRSGDDGVTWAYSSNGMSAAGSSLVASGDTLLAGSMKGIFRSINEGVDWVESDSGFPEPSYKKRVNRMFAEGGIVYAGSDLVGLWKSTNGGSFWLQDTNSVGWSIGAVEPIYAITKLRDTLYIGTLYNGLFIVPGENSPWIPCPGSPGFGYVNWLQTNGDEILASYHSSGVYRRRDDASNWQKLLERSLGLVHTDVVGGIGGRLLLDAYSMTATMSIGEVFSTTNLGGAWGIDSSFGVKYFHKIKTIDNVTYLNADHLKSSSDAGATWTVIDGGLPYYVNAVGRIGENLIAVTGGSDFLHEEEWGGVFGSTNEGLTWSPIGLQDSAAMDLATVGSKLFVLGNHEIYRTDDVGQHWTTVSLPLGPDAYPYSLVEHYSSLFVLTSSGVLRSLNFGDTWEAFNDGLPITSGYVQARALSVGNLIIMGRSDGVYFSDGMTNSWTGMNGGLSGGALQVSSIALVGSQCVIATAAGVYHTPVDTASPSRITAYHSEGWDLISVPTALAPSSVRSIFNSAISDAFGFHGSYQREPDLAHGNGYWIKFGDASIVYLQGSSLDRDTIPVGDRWNMIGSLSRPVPVSSITSIPPGITASQFFEYDAKLGRYVTAEILQPSRGYFVKANTPGFLVLSSSGNAQPTNRLNIALTNDRPPSPPGDETGGSRVELREFSLEPNYPNPFNPSTRIGFTLPARAHVYLAVFNTLGQQIVLLVDGDQEAGYHEVQFDASAHPSGLYFYRLTAGSFVESRKLILLK